MASVGVTVGVTNPNPVRRLVQRTAVLKAQKSIDGLSYTVTHDDGTVVTGVPLWFIDGFYMPAPGPTPIIDRPKGAASA